MSVTSLSHPNEKRGGGREDMAKSMFVSPQREDKRMCHNVVICRIELFASYTVIKMPTPPMPLDDGVMIEK